MSRAFALAGGILFVASLLFFVVTVGWQFHDSGPWPASGGWRPVAIDVLLFSLFALHHSWFARTGVKAWITRVSPPALERSIYVWIASLLFIAVCGAWRPVPGVLWEITGTPAILFRGVQLGGAIFTLAAARRLDVLWLAGVRQVLDRRDGAPAASAPPVTSSPPLVLDRGPYGIVRHPIYLGWFVMVWCAPAMNGSRLVFALVSCLYLCLAIPFEERDLRRTLGRSYDDYMTRVRWKVLPGLY